MPSSFWLGNLDHPSNPNLTFMAGQFESSGDASQASRRQCLAPSHSSIHGCISCQGTNSILADDFNTTIPPLPGNTNLQYGAFQANQYHHTAPVHDATNIYGSNQSMEFTKTEIQSLPLRPFPSQPAEGSKIQRQNQAILDFLERGTNPDRLPHYVENFKIMQRSGNYHDLAIMAEIPTEELAKRVHDVKSQAPQTFERRSNLKQEPSDEDLEPPPTRAFITPNDKGPMMQSTMKKSSVHVYGCPGNGGKCQERKNRYWRSKKEFRTHFETHLKEYEMLDGYKCPACEKRTNSPGVVSIVVTSFSHSRDLATHIWSEHMVPSTTTKLPQGTAVATKKKSGPLSAIEHDQTSDAKPEFHTQSITARARDVAKSYESSGIQCGPSCGTKVEFPWVIDNDMDRA